MPDEELLSLAVTPALLARCRAVLAEAASLRFEYSNACRHAKSLHQQRLQAVAKLWPPTVALPLHRV